MFAGSIVAVLGTALCTAAQNGKQPAPASRVDTDDGI